MDILQPAQTKDDWAKKGIVTFIVILLMLIFISLIEIILQDPSYSNIDQLTISFIMLLPLIMAIFAIYAIFRADFVG